MFLRDYFNPPADIRFCEDDDRFIAARSRPVSETISQVANAGMHILRVAEPQPLPLRS